jgi:hypothetical protein
MIDKNAELSWTRSDFHSAGREAPDELHDDVVTEGELMTEEEAEEWLQNSIKTLRVLSESDPVVFERLYAGFVADVRYLVSLDKMGLETIFFVMKRKNLTWQND